MANVPLPPIEKPFCHKCGEAGKGCARDPGLDFWRMKYSKIFFRPSGGINKSYLDIWFRNIYFPNILVYNICGISNQNIKILRFAVVEAEKNQSILFL